LRLDHRDILVATPEKCFIIVANRTEKPLNQIIVVKFYILLSVGINCYKIKTSNNWK